MMQVQQFIYLPLLLLAIFTSACSGSKEKTVHSKPEDVVLTAYNSLINGDYAKYVSCVQSNDSITESYRNGLINAAKQFMAREKEEKGGIASVNVISAKTNESGTYSLVMLSLCFGDSTSEEVAIPVVKINDSWRLR